MITFDTQKDFEDAVMNVLAKRLGVDVQVQKKRMDYCGDRSTVVNVALNDKEWGTISNCEDYA